MSYFKRREKIYAGLDADRVDEATFNPEGPDHPCYVLVPMITLEAAEALTSVDVKTAADNITGLAVAASVVIERLDGRWDYYPGGRGDWPQRWADAEHEERVAMARKFSPDELNQLATVLHRKSSLTEEEQGE